MVELDVVGRPVADGFLLALGDGAQRAQSILRRHRLRPTGPRLAVLGVLAAAPGHVHLSAAEVVERLSCDGDGADRSTVRRTLSLLARTGVLHELLLPGRVTSYGVADRPHHHAVCTTCGGVTEIPDDGLAAVVTQARGHCLFVLAATGGVTLHVLCADCLAGQQRRRA